MRFTLRLFTVLTAILLSSSYVFSQSGKIAGKITDGANGEGLPFVNVIIEGTQLGAATDIDGVYFVINVPPGAYTLKASAIGYNASAVSNIRVASGLTTVQDFKLSPASVQMKEDVVIIATKPLVQKDLTASTAIVGDELIGSLPVTQIGDVLQLQAGITVGNGGELHMRGGRSGQISYQIDGVPVTDGYDNSNVIDVGTNSVKELQVISGAFNAEFGSALSGIVNIVTKDGGNSINGNFGAYVGGFFSNRQDIFWDIQKIKPTAVRNFEGSLSGPIIKDKMFFFANGKYYGNDGYLYGKRTFLVSDVARENSVDKSFKIANAADPNLVGKDPGGDGSYIPMNKNERIFAQGKLTYRLFQGMTARYSYIYDKQNYTDYNSSTRLTPDNNLLRFRNGVSQTVSLNHALSAASFYTLNISYFYKDYRHYLYENPYTGDPVHPTNYVDNRLKQNPPYSFDVGGTDNSRFTRNTGTISAKLDWEWSTSREVGIKFGGEFKQNRVYYDNVTLIPMTDATGAEVRPYNVMEAPVTSLNHDRYLRNPQEMSGYLQTKVEAFNLIFNAGVRFDAFNPDGIVLSDPTDPDILRPVRTENQGKTIEERRAYWYKKASWKYQFSPRLGIAFPITDRGVIHFSYGHFFQLPGYELLYNNPDFKVSDNSGNVGLVGNSDLQPQKTVKGEIGLQQQLSDDMAVDVTMFFEDFRNLTGTQTQDITIFGTSSTYSQYANSDFGFAKGFIIKFEKRFGTGLAVNLDYTYSVTKGNASNPADARNALLGGASPETFIAALDWDQTHTLNLTASYTAPGDYGISMIWNYFTGQPYTPAVNKNTRVTQNAFPRNSSYKPDIFNIDMRAYKDLKIGDINFSVFVRVFNLLDLDNARGLYADTGDPRFTFGLLDARNIKPKMYYNTLDELYTNPSFYSSPRRVEVGASINF